MKIIGKVGREDIAIVYMAETKSKRIVEFVESVQPPIPREEKWVLIVSSLDGCPVKCKICDAGGFYKGKLSKQEIIDQIDYMVQNRFPDRIVAVKKFKIQFARIGEPSYNSAVLDVLEEIPARYSATGLIVCISTIAPSGSDEFFQKMLDIKKRYYNGKFQLQFSIHTTDENLRRWLVPTPTWNFETIADYGNVFFQEKDRKIALNFALAENMPVEPEILLRYFDPEKFLIKITPVNPTYTATENGIISRIVPEEKTYEEITRLSSVGYEIILSIGELEENKIGSNCGQYITHFLTKKKTIESGYSYPLISCNTSISGEMTHN